MAYLGLDLGTSGLRALLVDDAGRVLASAEASYASTHPKPGWSEQNPQDWIDALEAAVGELRSTQPTFQNLRGLAVSGHMHGAVLLDADGAVLRPCIMWNDSRAADEASVFDQQPKFRALSGNIVFPGFTAPKLAWVAAHEPDVFGRVAKVLLPAAYLNFYLTGDYVSDMSDASGTSWLDVGKRAWSEDLLSAGGMAQAQMPRVVEGSAVAGELREDLRKCWGLSAPVIVAGGAGDNAASSAGIGALDEGQGFVSLGTSGVVLVARDGYRPAPETALHTFCHAVPERWYQMGVMLSAASSLSWFAGITGATAADLAGELPTELRAPSDVHFLPYLSGERTPHNDATICAGFLGLSVGHARVDMTQGLMEGVAFGLRDSLEALRATDARPDHLLAIGGGVGSNYWLKLVATVFDLPLLLPEKGALGAALGAARLAMVAETGAAPEEVMHPPEIRAEIKPDAGKVEAFDTAYAGFRELYPAVRALGGTANQKARVEMRTFH